MIKKGSTFIHDITEYDVIDTKKGNWLRYQISQKKIKASRLLTKFLKEEEGFTAIAKWFIACKKMTHKRVKCVRNPDLKKSIDTIRLLCEKDNYELQEIVSVLQFTFTDTFYKDKVLSLTTLRTKSQNGLTKFENMKASMKSRKRKITKPQEEQSADYEEL